jgi:hypothetical protein
MVYSHGIGFRALPRSAFAAALCSNIDQEGPRERRDHMRQCFQTMTRATRLRAQTLSTRLTVVMVVLISLTAAVSCFGPAASSAAVLCFTVFAVAVARDIACPFARMTEAAEAFAGDGAVEVSLRGRPTAWRPRSTRRAST